MKWKGRLIHAGVLAAIFLLSVLVFGYFTNKSNRNMTTDMGAATRPQIAFSYNGYAINDLPAYKQEMKLTTVRDSITPVTNGQLQMTVKAYENVIQSISYQVYSLDGAQTLLDQEIQSPGETVALSIDGEGLLTEERVLKLVLHLDDGDDMYYYTHIVDANGLNALECLDYIHDFHENALAKAEGAGIGNAIEPNNSGDNSTLQHVTINSNYEQVTWGDLHPNVDGNERWTIKEINGTFTTAVLEYRVQATGEENEQDEYQVREYFKVRHVVNGSKTYLLDYDRTMDQIFDATEKILSEKGVILGIASADLPYKSNKSGTIVSFVQANEVWNYNRDKDEVSLVFSFADTENTDVRTLLRQHEIKILSVDESGNTVFAVYGYMNRGSHEAETGIAIYYYDIEKNSVVEKAFITSDEGYERTMLDYGSLVYYNESDSALYTLIGGTLYETNLDKKKQTELTKNLESGQCAVSADGHLVAYRLQNKTEIAVRNLSSGNENNVSVGSDEQIVPVGFVNDDFVYGVVRNLEVTTSLSGEELLPIYKIEIVNNKNKVVKTYEQEGIYILSAEIDDNMITLKRAVQNGDSYSSIAEDYITSNEETEERNITLETYVTELKEKQLRITFADGIEDKETKLLKPKQVVVEQVQRLEYENVGNDSAYYVYGQGKLQGVFSNVSRAVQEADEYSGTVVDENQYYIWIRGNRDLKYSIQDDEKIELLRTKLAGGASPSEALKEVYDAKTLDLSGCSVSQLLYVINQGMPVIAVLDNGETVLMVGYGEKMLTYIIVSSGESVTDEQENINGAAYFGAQR